MLFLIPLGLFSVYCKLNCQVTNGQRQGILFYLDYIRNINRHWKLYRIFSVPQPDPNQPKPEGRQMTPVKGEPLGVVCNWPPALEAALQRWGTTQAKCPCLTALDVTGKPVYTLTYGELSLPCLPLLSCCQRGAVERAQGSWAHRGCRNLPGLGQGCALSSVSVGGKKTKV